MSLRESSHVPLSTYRVQLHGKFIFADLGRLTPYFRELGISDLYLPPIFTAVPGSTHGYDVTDYSQVNPELGGLEEFRNLAGTLRAGGCSLILDFVPNHMGIEGILNQWWREVLEFGPSSRYASFFDIQWKSEYAEDHPRVLVPILSDHYGRLLERGQIKLAYEKEFSIQHGETSLPIRPESYGDILTLLNSAPEKGGEESQVAELAAEFQSPGAPNSPNPAGGQAAPAPPPGALKARWESLLARSPRLRAGLAALIRRLNGEIGVPHSFDELHRLIEKQHYRLARWQAGAHEINYRRFFAIDTLVGLRMEKPEVFREVHALLGRLLADGCIAGLRIDHIDGLRQPEDYLACIQWLDRAEDSAPLFLLVEKILGRSERIPETWPVQGTTGYDFISELGAVLVDGTEEPRFDQIYRRFTGESGGYAELVCQSKRLIIAEMFATPINNLGAELVKIIAGDRLWRDLTRHELTTAVSELAVHMPVYRTYRRRREAVGDPDRIVLDQACSNAIAANPHADPEPFTFVRDLLIGDYPPPDAAAGYRDRVLSWVLTFQQYTGAIMAKSVEDTAFYIYNRFIALNEVGCDPGSMGGTVEEFHRWNGIRQAECPLALLASSTHDSKMSEDVRARLYSISELAAEWEGWMSDWREKTDRHATVSGGRAAPDALDRYRFFQILLGAWPLSPGEVDDGFRTRLKGYFRKAVNEAKRHTSILNRNESYLAACDHFVEGVTSADRARDFLDAFQPCASRIARLGMVNSLAQVVLKCTVPGVPDFYQGNEIWDFSLVDPDNRRPVDYDRRQALLRSALRAPLTVLLENWRDGRIKLRLTRELLHLRGAFPRLFHRGSYRPVSAAGSFGDRVVCFMRVHESESLLVAVPRLSAKLGCPPLGFVWDDTRLAEVASEAGWKDALTGRAFPAGEPLFLREVFAELPFAVLQSQNRA